MRAIIAMTHKDIIDDKVISVWGNSFVNSKISLFTVKCLLAFLK